MCSISGGEISSDQVSFMLDRMSHRGPDDSKVIGNVGMNRLSIIDLKSPNLCPYQHKDHILLFNGEIYNYLELRKELEAEGHVFETQSDSEVLLKAYLEWGADCLQKLNGMFAFCVYHDGTYFLARDIAGEKPLYYSEYPFAFASEAKALDFKCKELPPAHFLFYKNNENRPGQLRLKQWWHLRPREIDMRTAEEELEWLLEDSVRLRTRSDVPYALYYSGGIDSTLISTFHDFEHKFTYQDLQKYEEEYRRLFTKLLWHLDYPIKSFSAFGLWKLAEEAKGEGIKVILSGEGADELFGGYVRYVPNSLLIEAQQHFPSYGQYFKASDVNEMGWEDFNGNMRELLRMGDRMSSAWGVENRCPFLDRRIIEFAFSLPHEAKMKGYDTKVILRNILKRRMPTYKFEEKHGLYCSVNKWLNINNQFAKKTYVEKQKAVWDSAKFKQGDYA